MLYVMKHKAIRYKLIRKQVMQGCNCKQIREPLCHELL